MSPTDRAEIIRGAAKLLSEAGEPTDDGLLERAAEVVLGTRPRHGCGCFADEPMPERCPHVEES